MPIIDPDEQVKKASIVDPDYSKDDSSDYKLPAKTAPQGAQQQIPEDVIPTNIKSDTPTAPTATPSEGSKPIGPVPMNPDALAAFGSGAKLGLTKAGGGAAHLIGSDVFDETIAKQEAELQKKYAKHPTAAGAGELVGGTLPYLAIPGGATGSLARRVATGAASGYLIDKAQYREDGSTSSGILGALLGGSFPLIGAAYRGIRNLVKPSSAAEKALEKAGSIVDRGALRSAKEAEKMGTFLTPGEATGNPLLAAKESKKYITSELQGTLGKKITARDTAIRKGLQETLDSVVKEGPEKIATKADDLYSAASSVQLKRAGIEAIENDPIIAKTITKMEKDPGFGLQNYTKGTVGYYNEVKKHLDDLLKYKGGEASAIGGSESVSRLVSQAKSKMVRVLDEASPEYQAARALSRKLKVREKYLEAIDDIARKGGSSEPSISQIYTQLFGTKAKEQGFLRDIKATGGDSVQAKRVINVMNKIKGSTLDRLLKQTTDSALRASKSGLAETAIGKAMSYKNNAFFELMTNPKWAKDVAQLHKMPKSMQAARFSTLLQKAGVVAGVKGAEQVGY